MFLAKDIWDNTAWHLAAEIGQLELLHILWYWAKDTLTLEELNNMFLSKMKKKGQPGTWQQRLAN